MFVWYVPDWTTLFRAQPISALNCAVPPAVSEEKEEPFAIEHVAVEETTASSSESGKSTTDRLVRDETFPP